MAYKSTAPMKRCPQCGAMMPTKTSKCPHCG